MPWLAQDAELSATCGRPPAESRDQIVALYHRAWRHSDTTIGVLPLEATGHVPWWPADRSEVTLHRIMAHVTAETHRHAGHADIVRELIDGSVGRQPAERQHGARRPEYLVGGLPEPCSSGTRMNSAIVAQTGPPAPTPAGARRLPS